MNKAYKDYILTFWTRNGNLINQLCVCAFFERSFFITLLQFIIWGVLHQGSLADISIISLSSYLQNDAHRPEEFSVKTLLSDAGWENVSSPFLFLLKGIGLEDLYARNIFFRVISFICWSRNNVSSYLIGPWHLTL